jgi:hypothetical protein
MHRLAITLCLAATALLASVASAAPPLAGVYKTTDLGGPIHTGRYTEGWLSGGGALETGTTLTAESFDGVSLGTEWRYSCATEIAPAVLLYDNVVGGEGNRAYRKTFVGGTIWLSGAGPWGDAEPGGYPGVIDSYVEFETHMYSGGVQVAAITNVQATAHFDAYPTTCMTFYVSNGVRVGSTALGDSPPVSGYPGFLTAGTCAPTAPEGAWWNMMTMTLSITPGCSTPVRTGTWGALKTLYR